jgi:hypothetical protein
MATIDPSIALGVKPVQIEDPINRFARQQELSVNMMKANEMQRGLQEEEAIRNYLRGADLSKPETRAGLTQFGKTGLAYGKALTEQETAGLQAKKTKLEINEKTLKAHRERMSDLALNPSPENTTAHIQDAIIRGDITPEQGAATLQQTLAMPFEQRKQYFLQLGADAAKRIEQMTVSEFQKQDLGIKRARLAADIDPELQAKISQAKEYGQTIGKNRATAEAALPGALQTAEEGIRLIDEMVGKPEIKDASGKVIQKGTKPHPGFSSYVGATLTPGMRFMEGSDTAGYERYQKQIEGKAFLEAFQNLKGGGSITEKEGEKATQAIMRMNKALNEKEYVKAAREIQDVLRVGMERSRAKAGQTSPVVPGAAPAAAPAGSPAAPAGAMKFLGFEEPAKK